MPIKYTEADIIAKCEIAIKTPETFYNEPFVNYTGCCSGTGRPYTEVIAEYLIEHIEDFKKIRQITREEPYYTGTHSGVYSSSSPRTEEIIAMKMFNYCKNDGGKYIEIGKIIDYQTPLKNVQVDEAGKIDLLAYNRHDNILRILELKKPDSTETMLRCVLEAYTYLRIVNQRKLIEDFHVAYTWIRRTCTVKACPFIFKGSNPHKEYMALAKRPMLGELMYLLDSVPIFIQKGYEIL